jgi:hypothetical protein
MKNSGRRNGENACPHSAQSKLFPSQEWFTAENRHISKYNTYQEGYKIEVCVCRATRPERKRLFALGSLKRSQISSANLE